MTTAQKTSKAELVAIYRLEFYKKQKNWKYYSQERKREEEKKKKAAKNAKSKLNLTYNVDPAPERDTEPAERETKEVEVVVEEEAGDLNNDPEVSEKGDNLNEAFVDTGTDENATPPIQLDPPNSPYSPRWSIQHWAAQCKAHCPEPEPTYPSDSNPQTFPSNTYPHSEGAYVTEIIQEHTPKYADLPPFRTDLPPFRTELPPFRKDLPPFRTDLPSFRTDLPPFRTDLPPFRTELPSFRTELPSYGSVLGKVRDWEQLGSYEECEQGWPATTQVWINRQEHGWFEGHAIKHSVLPADIPEEVEEAIEAKEVPDVVDGAEWALLDRASDWLSATSDKSSLRGCDSLPSISSGSFTCGAALAPHSTEIDLLSEECERAASLSAAALESAVARHAGTLRGLLAEVRRRADQASTSPVEPIYSFDEYPTRDVGPSTYSYHPPANDVIITGSFRNRPDLRGHTDVGVGRGRGRRVKLIGIGMGRPYRL